MFFNNGIKKQFAELQHSVNILIGKYEDNSVKYKGNKYATYSSMVTQLDKMYDGVADWGNQIAKNIMDVRAAFTIGQGVKAVINKEKVTDAKKASREIEFIQDFIKTNNLDEEVPQDWAKEAEIEGKFLARLIPNQETKKIEIRYIPWTAHEYSVSTAEEDYANYTGVTYKINKTGREVNLKPQEFVYKKFGGRTHKVNETTPKTGPIITQMENLDRALYDWRQINHLFASPTPVMECADAEQAKQLNTDSKKLNWKIGKLLITTAKFYFAEISAAAKESLEKEIITLAKFISGATGVPVHFLGLPDLMSNRSVSNDLFELINASTSKERSVWIGTYEEIFQKAMLMANENFQAGLNPDNITAQIPYVSGEKLQEIVDIWLPLFTANAIDLDTLLSKIPEIDAETVKENLEKKLMDTLDAMHKDEAAHTQETTGAPAQPGQGGAK